MLLYHPDKQVGNEEWVSERAKKVNEAYNALKDETKRAEYDRRLTEQMMSQKFPAAPSYGPVYHRRPSGAFGRHRSSEASSGWNSIRPYMPRILFVLYLIIASAVFGFIYLQNRSSHLEAELAPAPLETAGKEGTPVPAAAAPKAAAVEEHASNIIPAVPAEPGKDPVKKPLQEKKAGPTPASPLQTIKSWFQPNREKQAQDRVKEDSAPVTGKNMKGSQDNAGLPIITPLRPSTPEQIMSRVDPPQQHVEVQKAPAEPAKPVQELKQPAVTPPPPPPAEQISREEVEEFMQRYIRAYTKGDLNTFMALFSRAAVENNSLTYNQIRNAYKETFAEKINQYKINDMEIRTDSQAATVSGIYNVNRYISSDDRWVRYSGKIVWKLKRENAQLRIISTNYDK